MVCKQQEFPKILFSVIRWFHGLGVLLRLLHRRSFSDTSGTARLLRKRPVVASLLEVRLSPGITLTTSGMFFPLKLLNNLPHLQPQSGPLRWKEKHVPGTCLEH